MIDKGSIALFIILIAFVILVSHWYDAYYIRKNRERTTYLMFNKDHEFSTGAHQIRWTEATYIYEGGFISALFFNKYPSRVKNIKEKARRKGHNPDAFAFYDVLLLNHNYKKIVELNPIFIKFIKIRLWLMILIAISSILVINI